MAIFREEMSGIVIQGITGKLGAGFAQRMLASGASLVGGVTPGRGGQSVVGVPVFDTMFEAVKDTGATSSLVIVPADAVLDAVVESASAGIRLVSVYTEHVPVHDSARASLVARSYGTRMIGPNAAGVASPDVGNMSDIRSDALMPGPVGIVSKSGTLVYELIDGLRKRGIGVSTVACLGGDEVLGTTFVDILPLFAADPETKVVALIGEIGGPAELDAARCWAELSCPKPMAAYVAGWSSPPGKRMGHAGAIVDELHGAAGSKDQALCSAGATIASTITDLIAVTAKLVGTTEHAAHR